MERVKKNINKQRVKINIAIKEIQGFLNDFIAGKYKNLSGSLQVKNAVMKYVLLYLALYITTLIKNGLLT